MAAAIIVFCDIVGFSLFSEEEQERLVYSLSAEVTHALYRHLTDPESAVISLSTGDGLALALLDRQTSWSAELFSLLHRLMEWGLSNAPLRVGVHVGPVSVIRDINRHPNLCGVAVNVTQRIMDAAHPNQILISKEVYDRYIGAANTYRHPPFSQTRPARFENPVRLIAKHGIIVDVRVMYHEGSDGWVRRKPISRRDVLDKVARTTYIVDQLAELLQVPETHVLHIYEQSAFSTFGIPELAAGDIDDAVDQPEYWDLLVKQKRLLDELVMREQTCFSLIVSPIRTYNKRMTCRRLRSVLGWMEEAKTKANIRFVNARYDGPNRLIVAGKFCIDGYKEHASPGYELSVVRIKEEEIREAIEDFRGVFSIAYNSDNSNQDTIERLDKLYQDTCSGQG